ncbi:MAG: GNAT family N-acetyltransferase [Chitinophagaceae bacterium]
MLLLAEAHELPEIAVIAEPIWHGHYTSIIGKEQVEYMLKNMYSTDALIKQNNEGQLFYFIIENDKKVGFIAISKKSDGQWFLHKFYIGMEHQNLHIGGKVIDEMASLIRSKDKSDKIEIRLTVNRKNYKSINFYFKHDFRIEMVEDFDIGHGYFMNDFIMIKNIINV